MRKPWYHILYIRSPLAKIIIGAIAALIAVALLLFQFSIEEPRMAAQEGNWNGRSVEKGAELFYNNCANCHGGDGKGLPNVAPALHSKYFFTQRIVDVGWAGSLTDYVELTIAAGRPSKANTQWAQMMPTWSSHYGGPLRDDQVGHLVNFVMNWEKDSLAQTAAEDPFQCFREVPTKAQEGDKSPEALNIKSCTADGIAVLPGDPVPTPAAPAETAGPREPQVLFATLGCGGCHNLDLPQAANSLGQPGPNFGNLPETAGERVPGEDATTYVHNSIVNPNEYVNEGYIAGIMPQTFGEQMSEEELNSLVSWLLDPNRQR
ncbi:MAG: c-type cytochrome [Caldilineaceae bacterium]|nr:c-type cytochrome [Caldilineaceae bacterium]